MKKKWVGIFVVVFLVAAQFWPVDRTNPPVSGDNRTHWPWYGYVAPVSWLLASDVHGAREHVNFSEWESIPAGERPFKVKHIWKMVEDGEMPLLMYRLVHPEARLSEAQKKLLRDWSLSDNY
jgi:hypothetical protein